VEYVRPKYSNCRQTNEFYSDIHSLSKNREIHFLLDETGGDGKLLIVPIT